MIYLGKILLRTKVIQEDKTSEKVLNFTYMGCQFTTVFETQKIFT